MAFFGLILLVVGGVLWFVRGQQANRSRHLKLAQNTPIAQLKSLAAAVAQEIGSGDWRDYVSVCGTISAQTPLTSPMKGVPCIGYRNSVVREYEETVQEEDSQGNRTTRTQRGSETISSENQSVPFEVVDAQGDPVTVHPDGADLDTVEVLNEFKPGQPAPGSVAFGGFSVNFGSNLDYGSGRRRTLGYRYRESVMPLGRLVTVVGMAGDRTGEIIIEKPGDNRPFIISTKSQETLAKDATQGANIATGAMVGCWVLGAILLVIGLLS
ncbi:MAG: E3 ubiquitin ligase family protein [Leptolyngbya sp.]|nr:E3 ubiquitin ligase family protein [Leptolyngbya sp.]